MTEAIKTTAHCQCGALALHIEGAPVVQLVCHCSDCREFSGRSYVEAAFFKSGACRADGPVVSMIRKGGTGSAKTHYSCALCKTPLYVRVSALNGAWAIMADRLSPFAFEPQAHVWTSEKVDDVLIPEAMAQSPEGPPKEIVATMMAGFWGNPF